MMKSQLKESIKSWHVPIKRNSNHDLSLLNCYLFPAIHFMAKYFHDLASCSENKNLKQADLELIKRAGPHSQDEKLLYLIRQRTPRVQ